MSRVVKLLIQESLETHVENRLAESTDEERVAFFRRWFGPYCLNCGHSCGPVLFPNNCPNCDKLEAERWAQMADGTKTVSLSEMNYPSPKLRSKNV
jgi:hypothetical protein